MMGEKSFWSCYTTLYLFIGIYLCIIMKSIEIKNVVCVERIIWMHIDSISYRVSGPDCFLAIIKP